MSHVEIRVGTFSPSLLIHLARASGKLRGAGLEVRESLVASSPAQFASLEAGEFDVICTSPDNVLAYQFLSINPLERNLALRILSGIDRGLGLSLYLAQPLATIDSVRGQKLGVDVGTSGFAFVAYALLEQGGLHPGDYIVEAMGSTPRRSEALVEQRCAATILNAGNEFAALRAGCTLVSPVTDIGPYVGTVLADMADNAAKHRANEELAQVLLETAREVLSGERTAEVVEAAMAALHLSENEAQLHHGCLVDPATGYIANGKVDRASIETLIHLRRSYSPTHELDRIIQEIDKVIVEGALE